MKNQDILEKPEILGAKVGCGTWEFEYGRRRLSGLKIYETENFTESVIEEK